MIQESVYKILDNLSSNKDLLELIKENNLTIREFFSFIKGDKTAEDLFYSITDSLYSVQKDELSIDRKKEFLAYTKNSNKKFASIYDAVQTFNLFKSVELIEEFLCDFVDLNKTPIDMIEEFHKLDYDLKSNYLKDTLNISIDEFYLRMKKISEDIANPEFDDVKFPYISKKYDLPLKGSRSVPFRLRSFREVCPQYFKAIDDRNKRKLFYTYYISSEFEKEKAEEIKAKTISLPEATRILGVTHSAVLSFAKRYKLGPVYRISMYIRFKKKDVLKWARENKDILKRFKKQ